MVRVSHCALASQINTERRERAFARFMAADGYYERERVLNTWRRRWCRVRRQLRRGHRFGGLRVLRHIEIIGTALRDELAASMRSGIL